MKRELRCYHPKPFDGALEPAAVELIGDVVHQRSEQPCTYCALCMGEETYRDKPPPTFYNGFYAFNMINRT